MPDNIRDTIITKIAQLLHGSYLLKRRDKINKLTNKNLKAIHSLNKVIWIMR